MTDIPVQGTWEITIDAPLDTVWAVLDDSSNLPRWCAFMVKDTTGGKEGLGAMRECTLDSGGRRGRVKERCIDYEPRRRIRWIMDDDTLGITRMLDGFSFGFTLREVTPAQTCVVFDQRWRPRTWLAKILAPLVMRRQMARTNMRLLNSLRDYLAAS